MADKIGTDEYGEILIYQTDDGQTNIEVKIEDDTVWLTQQQLTELYQCSKSNISEHIKHKNYDKKYNDMQERLDKLYDEITDIENAMEEVETRLYNIRQDKISEDNVYQFLLFFDKLYDKFTDLEKKTFLKSFLSDVFIYEEEQKDGRILKGLRFKFPIYMNGRNVLGVDWDNESTDETIVVLHRTDS